MPLILRLSEIEGETDRFKLGCNSDFDCDCDCDIGSRDVSSFSVDGCLCIVAGECRTLRLRIVDGDDGGLSYALHAALAGADAKLSGTTLA